MELRGSQSVDLPQVLRYHIHMKNKNVIVRITVGTLEQSFIWSETWESATYPQDADQFIKDITTALRFALKELGNELS